MGSNWESKNAGNMRQCRSAAPFAAPFGQAQGRQDKAAYEKPQGTRAYPGLQKPVLLLNGLMSRLKPRPPGVRRLRNPKSPGAASFLYVRFRAGPAGAVTAYGIGDVLTCGGWRRGRARGRGAERGDAIARGRMRARSRSCCRRPDTRFSR